MTYWGFDHEIDEGAERLWWLSMSHADASLLANQLSSAHDATPPQIGLNYPDSWVIGEIKADPEVLDYVIELDHDAFYERPSDDHNGRLVFNGVLTDHGNSVPVLLVVHEMAHHIEYANTGRLGGHDHNFENALRDLLGQSMSLLNLDTWSDSDWLSFQPTESRGSTPNEAHASRIKAMKTKWSTFLGQ